MGATICKSLFLQIVSVLITARCMTLSYPALSTLAYRGARGKLLGPLCYVGCKAQITVVNGWTVSRRTALIVINKSAISQRAMALEMAARVS